MRSARSPFCRPSRRSIWRRDRAAPSCSAGGRPPLGVTVRVSTWTISPGFAGLSPVGLRRAHFRWLRAALGAFLRRAAGSGGFQNNARGCARRCFRWRPALRAGPRRRSWPFPTSAGPGRLLEALTSSADQAFRRSRQGLRDRGSRRPCRRSRSQLKSVDLGTPTTSAAFPAVRPSRRARCHRSRMPRLKAAVSPPSAASVLIAAEAALAKRRP